MLNKYKKKVKKVEDSCSYFRDGKIGPIQVDNKDVKVGKEYIVLKTISGG